MHLTGGRILVLSNFYAEGHGGTPESVHLLARELRSFGVRVDVACNVGLLRDVQECAALPTAADHAAFCRNKPDPAQYNALFVAGSWNPRAPLLVLKAVRAGIPVAYAPKGCLCRAEFSRPRDMRRVPYLLLVEWLLLMMARHVIFSSKAEQAQSVVPGWLWRRKVALLPEPFRGDIPVSAARQNAGIVAIGFLAEITPRKGLAELIAGLGRHLRSRPSSPVRLRIAGEARPGSEVYLGFCRSLAELNGAAGQIEWCGPIRGSARQEFYNSLNAFMCPSRFESFGLTPLEALWHGKPVCASAGMGVLEYLHEDAPVLRLASLDENTVAAAIDNIVDNAEDWRRRGEDWHGRSALDPDNAHIARSFAQLFFGQT
jgi:glycosyltransferase involved in cell wall biosynthesis